jgi:hypothetical protein
VRFFFLKILETLLEAEKQRDIYIKTRIKNVSSKVAVILFSFWCWGGGGVAGGSGRFGRGLWEQILWWLEGLKEGSGGGFGIWWLRMVPKDPYSRFQLVWYWGLVVVLQEGIGSLIEHWVKQIIAHTYIYSMLLSILTGQLLSSSYKLCYISQNFFSQMFFTFIYDFLDPVNKYSFQITLACLEGVLACLNSH